MDSVNYQPVPTADAFNRRHFLKLCGKGLLTAAGSSAWLQAAAAWASPAQEAQSTDVNRLKAQTAYPLHDSGAWPESERVGYALVGLGKLSQGQLLPAFQECKKSKLVALVSGDANKANHLAAEHGVKPTSIYTYENYEQLAHNPDVQAVYIVLPNHLHAEYTQRSAKAGKHVLCEKPMANSVSDCQAMIQATRLAGKQLMIAYRSQYEPHHREMIRLAQKQAFGRVKHIVAENCQNESLTDTPWRLDKARAGGGALPDVGIYCLNAARYITGEEPVEISARLFSTPGDPRFASVEESVNFFLRFPSGATAACLTSYGAYTGRRYRVYAEHGWFEMDPAFSYQGLGMRSQTSGAIKEYQLPMVNQFSEEIDHFSECVRDQKTPFTPGEEGLQDVRLIEAIYRSAASGQVITLNNQ